MTDFSKVSENARDQIQKMVPELEDLEVSINSDRIMTIKGKIREEDLNRATARTVLELLHPPKESTDLKICPQCGTNHESTLDHDELISEGFKPYDPTDGFGQPSWMTDGTLEKFVGNLSTENIGEDYD